MDRGSEQVAARRAETPARQAHTTERLPTPAAGTHGIGRVLVAVARRVPRAVLGALTPAAVFYTSSDYPGGKPDGAATGRRDRVPGSVGRGVQIPTPVYPEPGTAPDIVGTHFSAGVLRGYTAPL
jgi:hypothetical protein